MKSFVHPRWKWIVASLAGGFVIMNVLAFNDEPLPAEYGTDKEAAYKVYSPGIPETMTFAGENVPLGLIDVREKIDRELLVNTYWHSNTFLMIKRSNRWFDIIEPILEIEGIPADFKYLALIESGLTNVVSPAGATGFWQFMKDTGRSYGLEVNSEVDERYHLEKATFAACNYLNDAYDRFGNWALVAASYNMGMGGVNKKLTAQKVDSYWDLLLNSETSRYVYRILAVKEILSHPADFGFILEEEDLYQPYAVKTITVDSGIMDLASFALDQGINYKVLKTLNPWLIGPKLINKSKKEYVITLPIDSTRFRLD